jgi:hypothetical protein
MAQEINLIMSDEFGRSQKVPVRSKRFTIGRTAENDLAIENSSLSRRHAVIETFDGLVLISDCGSQNGTEVNGSRITSTATLENGHLVTLAGVCDLEVEILNPINVSPTKSGASSHVGTNQPKPRRISYESSTNSSNTYLLALSAAVLIILIAGGLILYVFISGRQSSNSRTSENSEAANNEVQDRPRDSVTPAEGGNTTSTPPADEAKVLNVVETSAAGVMSRISSDDKPYSLSEKALHDIARKVNQYKTSPSLAANLTVIERSSAALAARARREGIEPGLLIYVVLTEAESRHTTTDPGPIAQSVLSDLVALRSIFGTTDADSSLLIIAASKMGTGNARSHPLLGIIRRLVKNPLTQRNVWFLNDHGGLEPSTYDFVISVVALGVIAQNPQQFQIAANPLVF